MKRQKKNLVLNFQKNNLFLKTLLRECLFLYKYIYVYEILVYNKNKMSYNLRGVLKKEGIYYEKI